jgi:hypothetical protein
MNRFILTEDEKRHISNLHNNYISEQNTQDVAVQPGVFNAKVQELQKHLISLGHKIDADGKLGPKTLGAAQAAYLSKTTQPVAATTVQPVAATTVQPVAATTEVPPSTQQQFDVKKNNFNLNADEFLKNPYSNPNSLENQLGLNNQ